MKIIINLINVLIIIVIVSQLAVAPGSGTDADQGSKDPGVIVSSKTFDPSNPEKFDWINGDYKTIADWSKIPLDKIRIIPPEKLDYDQLKGNSPELKQRRLLLTADQLVQHLEKIENLAVDVNPFEARVAVKKATGITVYTFRQGARIEQGILKAT